VALWTVLAPPMAMMMVLRHRWFCRNLCPMGLLVETCGLVRRSANAKRGGYRRVPALGQWFALATLGGAAVGYPLLLWLDPLAILSGSLIATSAYVLIALCVVMALSVILPNFWCAKLCPLGGTQDVLAGLGRLIPRTARPARADLRLGRRVLLFSGLGAAGSAAISSVLRDSPPRPLRPPGALAETAFKGLCIRCGNCVRSCPSGIIHQDMGSAGLAGLLAPVVRFHGKKYCLETCHACTRSCPSGAIEQLTLAQKIRRPIGLAKIDRSDCIMIQEEGECGYCMLVCPQDAIVDGFNEKTYEITLDVSADDCNGCGACVHDCPTKVIRIDPV
jgi:ferredoxin